MKTRTVWGILLGALLVGASPPASTETKPLAREIVGRWRLVSIESRDDASKEWEKRYGESPLGYLDYAGDGRMSVQIAKMPRPKFASGKDREPTPEEARDAYLGYAAYFGTYSVDEGARVITHHVQASLGPSYAGTDQRRPAELSGNRLILSDGKTFKVVWEREK